MLKDTDARRELAAEFCLTVLLCCATARPELLASEWERECVALRPQQASRLRVALF